MLADRLEEQLPVDTVEEGAYIEIEHPVAAPAALASLAHGIDRRFAGPVAVGVGMEHRLQNGLQAPTGHLLGNAICDSWNTQWPRPTIRLRNIDPSAPAEENSSLTTAGSRACRGCPKGWPRTPQSTVHLLLPLPGWPSHA